MYDKGLDHRIRETEMALGNSHHCNGCGAVFLQHQDGCPNCGASASVSSLNDGEIIPSDSEVLFEVIIDFETGEDFLVLPGQSSPWPREEKEAR